MLGTPCAGFREQGHAEGRLREYDLLLCYRWYVEKLKQGLAKEGTAKRHHIRLWDIATVAAKDRIYSRLRIQSVVGSGLALQAKPDAKGLGWTPEQGVEWASNVEREWRLWAGV